MTIEDEHRDRIATAMMQGIAENSSQVDLEDYPIDVHEVLEIVCEEWNLRPPRTKKSKSYWIQSARELLDACGEFGEQLVVEYRHEFKQYMRENNGLAPFSVEGPNSLVKSVRALAGEKRSTPDEDDRSRYVKGEYADWIEH